MPSICNTGYGHEIKVNWGERTNAKDMSKYIDNHYFISFLSTLSLSEYTFQAVIEIKPGFLGGKVEMWDFTSNLCTQI
jgi:hypothetical protein